jgi:hypothetical protein
LVRRYKSKIQVTNKETKHMNSEAKEPINIASAEQGTAAQIPVPVIMEQVAEQEVSDTQVAQTYHKELWSKRFSRLVFIALTAIILISVIYRPAEVNPNEEYSTICGFKNLTGLPCPGCGLTHSFCEIGKGHVAGAIAWNWLGIPLFLLMVLIWLKALFILTNQYKPAFVLDRLAARIKPMRLTAIAFAIYGIGRIVYIFLYNPAARTSNPFSKLFSLLGG